METYHPAILDEPRMPPHPIDDQLHRLDAFAMLLVVSVPNADELCPIFAQQFLRARVARTPGQQSFHGQDIPSAAFECQEDRASAKLFIAALASPFVAREIPTGLRMRTRP